MTGVSASQATDLKHHLTTPVARLRGAAVRPGKTYRHSNLNKATNYLQSRLEKGGYLAAQVKLSGAE